MKLDKAQRQHLAEMFREGANLFVVGVVLAGFVEGVASPRLVGAALVFYILVVVITTWLRKGG